MATELYSKKSLPYVYEFDQRDIAGINACNDAHGFAVVKNLVPVEVVERLKEDVRQVLEGTCDPSEGASNYSLNFIEVSPTLASLLTYEPYMRIARSLYHNQPITLHRSAAIYKKVTAPVGAWHTDWEPKKHPYNANALLNNSGACSNWIYLNGTHPSRAGLAIIPDSHRVDWSGPEGFEFTRNRKSFYRKGENPSDCMEMDFPEAFPLFTDPGDMIIFAERTYHGVFAHHGDVTRLSCGLGFRPASYSINPCWPLPESSKAFIASCPPEIQSLVEEYTGIDNKWVSSEM
jgi:hypothetical protein